MDLRCAYLIGSRCVDGGYFSIDFEVYFYSVSYEERGQVFFTIRTLIQSAEVIVIQWSRVKLSFLVHSLYRSSRWLKVIGGGSVMQNGEVSRGG